MFASDIPKAHDRKPDPAEPWRYVCPACKGQVQGHHRSRRYTCSSCSQSWAERDLYDVKLDE